jgi:hypothetical protein
MMLRGERKVILRILITLDLPKLCLWLPRIPFPFSKTLFILSQFGIPNGNLSQIKIKTVDSMYTINICITAERSYVSYSPYLVLLIVTLTHKWNPTLLTLDT